MPKKFLFGFAVLSLLFITGCATSDQTSYDNSETLTDMFASSSVDNSRDFSKPEDYQATSTPSPTNINQNNQSTPMPFDVTKHYFATLHTSAGDIEIALNFGQTPNTVENFVNLSRENFYNGTIFHRVIKGFMIQGGDPKGDGTGGPGYQFNDEPFTGDYTRGTVAMANSGPNTNGSQFFIMQANNPLPKNYVIFGHVAKGLAVVDKIADSKVTYNSSHELSKPVNPVVVKNVDIREQ